MLYKILYSMHDIFSPLNVFRYITFRTALAVFTAMLLSLLIGPKIIGRLKQISVTQQIRDDGPQTHLKKTGTPTMGGLIIIICILVSILLWGDLGNIYIWIMSLSLVGYGGIGLLDDYLKVTRKNPKGLRSWYKFGAQILLALLIGVVLYINPNDPFRSVLSVPFFKRWLLELGWFYIPFCTCHRRLFECR